MLYLGLTCFLFRFWNGQRYSPYWTDLIYKKTIFIYYKLYRSNLVCLFNVKLINSGTYSEFFYFTMETPSYFYPGNRFRLTRFQYIYETSYNCLSNRTNCFNICFMRTGIINISISFLEVTCPPIDPEQPVFLPHETECGKFYECSGGKKFLLKCAPGAYWDQTLTSCATNVDCHGLLTSTAPALTTTTENSLN